MEIAVDSLDGSVIFHAINEISGFVLYMQQQIPSLLQDITLEFNSLCSEYKELNLRVSGNGSSPERGEANASEKARRQNEGSQARDSKIPEANASSFRSPNRAEADDQRCSSVPRSHFVDRSPLRPQHVYELSFSSATAVPSTIGEHEHEHEHEHEKELDFGNSRAAEVLCRKAIRGLISKGAGCASYSGPSNLFLLIVPLRLKIMGKTQDQNMDALPVSSETSSSDGLVETVPNDFIWFQCRHVIKGLASNTPTEAE